MKEKIDARYARLMRVMMRMRKGIPVTIAALGGSITTGYASSPMQKNSWASLVAAWWKRKARLCSSQVTFLNEGVSGTDSAYASVRVADHILRNKADFVFLEFAMNDQWLQKCVRRRSYEGVVRQMLDGSDRGILALFVNERDAPQPSNQREQKKICAWYGIPYVSWKDEANAEFGGNPDWKKWFSAQETVHPNNEGHACIAEYIIARLEAVWASLPQKESGLPGIERKLPKPLTDCGFQFAELVNSSNAEVLTNCGWEAESPRHGEWVKHGGAAPGWSSSTKGAEIAIKVRGTSCSILYSESDQFRNCTAWVEFPDGTEGTHVTVKCYSAMRTGYLGWASRELFNAGARERTVIVHVRCSPAKKENADRDANFLGLVVTHMHP